MKRGKKAVQVTLSLSLSLPLSCSTLHLRQEEDIPPPFSCADSIPEGGGIFIDVKVAEILFRRVFFLHLILIGIFVIFLSTRVFLSSSRKIMFRPEHWHPPIIASTALAGVVGFAWQLITACSPSKAIQLAFYLSPFLSLASSVLFIGIGTPAGLAAGIFLLVFSVTLSLYSCWVSPRFTFAIHILLASTNFIPNKTFPIAILSILVSFLYASFMASGIGGAIAERTPYKTLFIVIILCSFSWSMQVVKNVVQVSTSRIKYLNIANGSGMDACWALSDTMKNWIGTISIGSAIAPIIGVFRGSSRAMTLLAGDTDEFMFSCADCCSGVASSLIARGNRWAYVRVGVFNKGFIEASEETWASFESSGLIGLIDSDLTGSFCFYCGVATGALSSLAAGIWALLLHTTYATETALLTFFMGYFLGRVAMAWPQACVSSYYVAYAENPERSGFDSTIPDRIQALQRSQT